DELGRGDRVVPGLRATAAIGLHVRRAAGSAKVEVREAGLQIALEAAQPLDLLAGLDQLLFKDGAHAAHAVGPVFRALPRPQEALDLLEREAHVLHARDPLHAGDSLLGVETKAAGRTRHWTQKPHLFIEMHRSDGLSDRLRELANLEKPFFHPNPYVR